MSKPCNCKKSAECEECPEWIFTFADLVMLMMGFFVILWVLKPSPSKENPPKSQEEWLKVVAAIRGSFGYMPDPKSSDPVDRISIQMRQHPKPDDGAGHGGETRIKRQGAEGTDPEV